MRSYGSRRRARGFPIGLACILAATLALAACGGEGSGGGSEGEGGRLSVATGGTGGVYSVYGGGLANVISKNLKGYEASAETTSASVDNLLLIADGGTDIAFTQADTAVDAAGGKDPFKETVPLRALAEIYTNYTQVVAAAGDGIEKLEDLKGKRVSVGSPSSGTEVLALRLLEEAGVDAKADFKRQQLGVEESAKALKDGSLDAFFWVGGLPTGSITDLATTQKIAIVPTGEYAKALKEKYGDAYGQDKVPADTYEGVDKAVEVLAVPNYLVVNEKMGDKLAYDLTKLLFDQKPALARVHPEAKKLDPERGKKVVDPVQLHPGAKRYYEESGGDKSGSGY